MKKQKINDSNNQSKSFVLPSDYDDNDAISDKEVHSFERDFTSAVKQNNQVIPHLDLKAQNLKSPSKNQDGQGEDDLDISSLLSPIMTCKNDKLDSQIKLGDLNYKKQGTELTAPQSNQKEYQNSPDKNNQNNGQFMKDPTQPISDFNKNDDHHIAQKQSNPTDNNTQQYKKQNSNVRQQNNTGINNSTNQRLHVRGPSQLSQFGVEITLDEGSEEDQNPANKNQVNSRNIKNKINSKEDPQLFDDSLVSAIQKAGHQQFIEDGDEYLEEDESSARRLIQGDRHSPILGKHGSQHIVVHDSNNSSLVTANGGLMSQKRQPNTTLGQSKEMINFIDQSKEDYQNNKQFPIISHNKNQELRIVDYQKQVAMLQQSRQQQTPDQFQVKKVAGNSQLLQDTDPIEIEQDQRATIVKSKSVKKQQHARNPTIGTVGTDQASSTNLNQITMAPLLKTKRDLNDQYNNDYDFEQEQSCLLDESQLKNALKMPNPLGTKAQLQDELGHYVYSNTEGKFYDEQQMNAVNDGSFYKIGNKDAIEIIDTYHDKCPLLELRKSVMRARVYIVRAAQIVIMNPIFEGISIMIIICNSIFLALQDPTNPEQPQFIDLSDYVFQGLYTIEMLFKIIGKGFIFNKGAYMRDSWNLLDFTIVVSGYAGYFGGGANLSALRSFRVLRPLRTISSIEGLRVIVQSLMKAIPLLRDTLLVLLFFFFIMAIAGVQLFSGILKARCVNIETGLKHPDDDICGGGRPCQEGYFCGKMNANPNYGVTNFDNFMYAFLGVFMTVTLEGWSEIMIWLWKGVASWIIFYFVVIVFIGTYFLQNLTLAVIKSRFTEEHKLIKRLKEREKKNKKKTKKFQIESDSDEEHKVEEEDELEMDPEEQFLNEEKEVEIYHKNKQKERMDDLFKKIEVAIRQKEIHDRLTPRTGLMLKTDRTSNKVTPAPSSDRRRSHMQDFQAPNARTQSQDPTNGAIRRNTIKITNYGQFVSQKYGIMGDDSSIIPGTEDTYNTQGITSNDFIGNFIGSKDLLTKNSARSASAHKYEQKQTINMQHDETIKEAEEESIDQTHQHDKTRSARGDSSSKAGPQRQAKTAQGGTRNNKGQKSNNNWVKNQPKMWGGTLSRKLEQHFEIARVSTAAPQQRSASHNTVKMSGMAKIKSKARENRDANNDSNEEQQRKKDIYDKIKKDFNMFKFLENDDFVGDNEQDSSDLIDELALKTDDYQVSSKRNNQADNELNQSKGFVRKSTGATAETKSFQKMSTLKRKNSKDMLAGLPKDEDNAVTEILTNNDSINKSKRMKRRLTLKPTHKSYISDQEEVIVNTNNKTFKQKALGLFTKNKKSNKEIEQQKKYLKDSLAVNTTSKSLERQSGKPSMSNTIVPEQTKLKETVRSKSEAAKQYYKEKKNKQFIERQNLVKSRRNQFFTPAIRNIGKTKADIIQEKSNKFAKQRQIKVGGGFEVPNPNSPLIENKWKIMRSGSILFSIGQLGQDHTNQESLSQNRGPSFLQPQQKDKYQKIKGEAQLTDDGYQDDQILDIDQILHEKKKKIKIKRSKFNFASQDDVFENRDKDPITQQVELYKPKPFNKYDFNNISQQLNSDEQAIKVKGYQKKIQFKPKTNFEELVQEEMIESDDNQETVLRRLEDEYNHAHRSNIHVTGTLSIVLNEHHASKKIMNNNYFININNNPTRYTSQGSFITPQLVLQPSKDASIMQDHSASYISVQSPGKSEGNMNSPRNLSILKRMNTNKGGQLSNRSTTPKRKSMFASSAGNRRATVAQSSLQKQSTMLISQQAASIANITRQQLLGKKPEVMTDQQILKRLNKEVRKSKVFQSVGFKKLPDKIMRKEDPNNQVIKKNVKKQILKKNGPGGLGNQEQEHSISSQEMDQLDPDAFLDREDLKCADEIIKAKVEAKVKARDATEWSGQDIMTRFDPYKARIAIDALNTIRVWPKGIHGYLKRARIIVRNIVRNGFYDNFLILCVTANTITLTLDRYGIDPGTQQILQTFNTIFTIIFAIEMGLKLIAIGLVKYLKDKMNYLDGAVVILSLVEMIFMSGSGTLSAFKTVRIFRTFRVLRVARLLRSMKSMMSILAVIQRSLSSFVYLAMLLFLFIFIYALLGMQVFGGHFKFDGEDEVPRANFDTFNTAFVTAFNILSVENWNTIMFSALRSDVNWAISTLYFISWIFIGNWMLLNLFLAILLDSFTSQDEEENELPAHRIAREKKEKEELLRKSGQEYITALNEMQMSNVSGKPEKGGITPKKKKKKKKKQGETHLLDESLEINAEALSQKKEEAKVEKALFEGIECENSFFILSKKNKLRILFYKIVQHGKFETVILVLIVLSSMKLVYDTYLLGIPETDPRVYISSNLDYVFTVCFAVESLIKCLAYGFIMDKNSYLRETWSQLDFFIVATSLIDVSLTNVDLPVIKILRLLRILRPLRFISHNSSMKIVVAALLSSGRAIINAGFVLCLIYMVFAIMGVNMFGGKMQYCTEEKYLAGTPAECAKANGEWKTYDNNFDNFFNGMITLFIVSTQEGWPLIMYQAIDGDTQGKGPKLNASPIAAYFFIIFVFIGAFFFMNLFVGVIFMEFERAQREEKDSLFLKADEIQWVDMMKMIVSTKPEFVKTPKNKFSQWVYERTKGETKFDIAIMCCIILNMVQMAINYEGQPKAYTLGLQYVNYFFTAVFAFEAVLKLIGQGLSYFSQTWNKFDFFVVCASFVDILMGTLQTASLKFLRVGPQLARVLRVLRVSRLFRLLNKYKGLQALLQTITFSLPSLFNVFALLMLVYFIFSVLGVFLFKDVTEGVIINEYMNFSNFGMALIILFRMSTGEDWPTIMYDTMNTREDCIPGKTCGTSIAPLFFIGFIMVCTYIMLNLFILVILQQFELYYLPDNNILATFREDLEKFKITWAIFAKDYDGIKIRALDLVSFFQKLEGQLGMMGEKEKFILRNIVKMNLESDEEGFIYFNELLFKAMKRIHGQERTKNKVLAEQELKTLQRLEQIKDKMSRKSRHNEKIKAVTVNPFLTIMYKSMSLKAWKKIYMENLEKRKEEIIYGIERESSDEEEVQVENEDYEYQTMTDNTVYSEDEDQEHDDQSFSSNDLNDNNEKNISKAFESQGSGDENAADRQYKKGFTIKLKKTMRLNDSQDNKQQQRSARPVDSLKSSFRDDEGLTQRNIIHNRQASRNNEDQDQNINTQHENIENYNSRQTLNH